MKTGMLAGIARPIILFYKERLKFIIRTVNRMVLGSVSVAWGI